MYRCTGTCTDIHVRYMYIPKCTYTFACTDVQAHVHTYIYMYIPTCTYTYMISTCTDVSVHVHIYVHVLIHTGT